MTESKTLTEKSEIFFLYESNYSQPNGDPFTGEQRYDEETKKALVSDVRIKRFIRDFLEEKGYAILVSEKVAGGKSSMKEILKHVVEQRKGAEKDVAKIMKAHIDVRLFGGISTLQKSDSKIKFKTEIEGNQKEIEVQLENHHTQITGPVQFALLNPSLNKIDLRPHQNTSVLLSKEENVQGAIATTSTVPYALLLIRGWVNPASAKYSGLQAEDVEIMLRALWESVDSSNTRSKSNQSALLLVQVVYAEDKSKLYGLDKKIKITPEGGKKEEALRAVDEAGLNLADFLQDMQNSDKVAKIRYYAVEILDEKIKKEKDEKKLSKVEKITFPDYKKPV